MIINKQIEELIEQVDSIEILPDDKFCDTDFLADIDPRRVEKFAELIIRKCARLACDTNLEDVDGGDSAILLAANRQILQHFGIE